MKGHTVTERIYWDWDELGAREAIDLEDAAGAPIPAIVHSIKAGLPTTRMLAAVAWIARRRTDPELTLEQVLDEAGTYNALAADATRVVPVEPDPDLDAATTG